MNNRIQAIIKSVGLKRIEFAKRLRLSAPYISELCSGKTCPSDRTISDICREFNVNEAWLRTGDGEMFRKQSRSDELAEYMEHLLQAEPEDIRQKFALAVSRLSTEQLTLLKDLAVKVAEEFSAIPAHSPTIEEEARAEAEEYYREILAEKERAAKLSALQNSDGGGSRLA